MPHRDPKRTLWQNYFHKNAPGSGIPAQMMPEGHCTQILPAGACELMMTWRDERIAAMAELGIVGPPFFPLTWLLIILVRSRQADNYLFLQTAGKSSRPGESYLLHRGYHFSTRLFAPSSTLNTF